MRRIGRELELAPAGPLDRRGDPPADRHRAHEDHEEQDGAISSSARIRVDWAWLTLSRFWATTTWSSPAAAPAIRMSIPPIVAVWGRGDRA